MSLAMSSNLYFDGTFMSANYLLYMLAVPVFVVLTFQSKSSYEKVSSFE